MDMHAAYRETGSYRAAAEMCGTTPKTVKRSVLDAQAVEKGQLPAGAHNYEAVRDVVVERVERTKGKMSAKRLFPIAQAAGYEGIGPELPPPRGRGQGRMAQGQSPGTATRHLVAGRHVGL